MPLHRGRAKLFVGCAGWSLRKELAASFPAAGSHLQRYAARFGGVEINSSFYRPHQHRTYVRWADATPDAFRFAVKLPRQITHLQRLRNVQPQVDQFADQVNGLGDKLGAVLVQLPPSLALDRPVAQRCFADLQARITAPIACEPRHRTWFEPEIGPWLAALGISRVAADPAIVPAAAQPGGDPRFAYYRWHGSPQMYYSSYSLQSLHELAARLRRTAEHAEQVWCIFDNTAEGEAQKNALHLCELLEHPAAT